MRLIGLCGRSGSGKSVFSSFAAQEGFKIIDCDMVYKDLVSYMSPCLIELSEAFGNEIIDENKLNRRALAPIVFSDPEKLKLLNSISHKHIMAKIQAMLSDFQDEIVILDAPTLFESGIYKNCHKIIAVVADDEISVSRIIARDNISRDEAISRLANQKSIEFLKENCDYILYNQDSIEQFKESSLQLINKIKEDCK